MKSWLADPPPPAAWRAPEDWPQDLLAAEQARAARGVDRRVGAGGQLARVIIKAFPRRRRLYAYLRWREGRKLRDVYLGEVNGRTRFENLQQGWMLAVALGHASERR